MLYNPPRVQSVTSMATNGAVDLNDILESIYISAKRRTRVLSVKHRTWSVNVYFGQSLEDPDDNVHSLEWIVVAKTKHKNTENLPDLKTGGNPVLVQFSNTAIVSWVGQDREELLLSVERSFREEITLR